MTTSRPLHANLDCNVCACRTRGTHEHEGSSWSAGNRSARRARNTRSHVERARRLKTGPAVLADRRVRPGARLLRRYTSHRFAARGRDATLMLLACANHTFVYERHYYSQPIDLSGVEWVLRPAGRRSRCDRSAGIEGLRAIGGAKHRHLRNCPDVTVSIQTCEIATWPRGSLFTPLRGALHRFSTLLHSARPRRNATCSCRGRRLRSLHQDRPRRLPCDSSNRHRTGACT